MCHRSGPAFLDVAPVAVLAQSCGFSNDVNGRNNPGSVFLHLSVMPVCGLVVLRGLAVVDMIQQVGCANDGGDGQLWSIPDASHAP